MSVEKMTEKLGNFPRQKCQVVYVISITLWPSGTPNWAHFFITVHIHLVLLKEPP